MPTTTERGYGTDHQTERRRLTPHVNAGHAYCQQGLPGNGSSGTCIMPNRWIKPGTPWALGHDDARTTWIGPCHARCNQRDGARRGGIASHRKRHQRTPVGWRSRAW